MAESPIKLLAVRTLTLIFIYLSLKWALWGNEVGDAENVLHLLTLIGGLNLVY